MAIPNHLKTNGSLSSKSVTPRSRQVLGRRIEKSKKRAVPDQEPVKIMSREDVLELMRLEKLGEKAEEASEAVSSAS